jgi:hypothetical protein
VDAESLHPFLSELDWRREPESLAFESSSSTCPACDAPLLCSLRDASKRILPFPLFSCARCAPLDIAPYYVEVGPNEVPRTLLLDEPEEDYEPRIRRDAAPTSVAVTFEQAPWAVPDDVREFERVTRVGGWPSWVQSPMAVACPKCDVPMEFLAQFPDPPGDLWSGDTGMFYAFACRDCRVAASFVQNA